jgi:hypothetical protein
MKTVMFFLSIVFFASCSRSDNKKEKRKVSNVYWFDSEQQKNTLTPATIIKSENGKIKAYKGFVKATGNPIFNEKDSVSSNFLVIIPDIDTSVVRVSFSVK